jgi:hypothetical protein
LPENMGFTSPKVCFAIDEIDFDEVKREGKEK